jgi:hypothetical protein
MLYSPVSLNAAPCRRKESPRNDGARLPGAAEPKCPAHDLKNRSAAGHSVGSMKGVPFGTVPTESEIAIYRRLTKNPRLIAKSVHGSPDGLRDRESHAPAIEIVMQMSVGSPRPGDWRVREVSRYGPCVDRRSRRFKGAMGRPRDGVVLDGSLR